MVIGCQSDSPVAPSNSEAVGQQPQFLKLPKNLSLARMVADTALITPERGGKLELDFNYDYVNNGVTRNLDVKMTLTFPNYAVTDTLVAMMTVDDEVLRSNIDLTFGPHGSTFLRPALLDVDIRGIDLSGLGPNDRVYLWYNDNGTWVRMDSQRIIVDVSRGWLKCIDGELPHFSAYAFGR
ncbi:MAG: hypothetical protein AAB393_03965 [Bacteroidota bacterium]